MSNYINHNMPYSDLFSAEKNFEKNTFVVGEIIWRFLLFGFVIRTQFLVLSFNCHQSQQQGKYSEHLLRAHRTVLFL